MQKSCKIVHLKYCSGLIPENGKSKDLTPNSFANHKLFGVLFFKKYSETVKKARFLQFCETSFSSQGFCSGLTFSLLAIIFL